jgi:putative ABC transport system substrate-binding protein
MTKPTTRRRVIAVLGGAATAWPLAARAQQAERVRRIGVLTGSASDDADMQARIAAFVQGLAQLGWTDGQNLRIDTRWSGANAGDIRKQAVELAALATEVIVAFGSPATRGARQATSTIPIVMIGVGDPVRAGFVTNLARPEGNITGNSQLAPDLIGKRLEILKDYVPGLARVAFMWNPDNDSNLAFLEELIIAVPALSLQLISVPMRTSDDFQAAIAAMMRRQPNAFVTTGDRLIQRNIREIIDFMAKHRLPAMYQEKEIVRSGGLMAYGTSLPDLFRRGAWYVHRILQGAKPAELPVEQPTKFEFAINLKTAKALGLTVPDRLLAIADEVIE